MRLSKRQLKRIIREERLRILRESSQKKNTLRLTRGQLRNIIIDPWHAEQLTGSSFTAPRDLPNLRSWLYRVQPCVKMVICVLANLGDLKTNYSYFTNYHNQIINQNTERKTRAKGVWNYLQRFCA